jgi:hypothetical protein
MNWCCIRCGRIDTCSCPKDSDTPPPNINLKGATHRADVVSNGRTWEVWLRETPKTWTDGKHRWKKFDRKGNTDTDPSAITGFGERFITLKTATIRRLTVSDLREPLAQKLADAANAHVRTIEARDAAIKRAQKAGEAYGKAYRALQRYDQKHGTGPEPTE